MNPYENIIRTIVKSVEVDPRHVEAYIRLEWGTLQYLSFGQFVTEVGTAIESIAANGYAKAEALAKSYGL